MRLDRDSLDGWPGRGWRGGEVAAVLHEAGVFAKSTVQTPGTPVGLPPDDLPSPIKLAVCLNLPKRMRESKPQRSRIHRH